MKSSQYHRVLNIPEGASPETIKKVAKELLKKYHPDLNQKHRQWAETQTKRILEAYQVLIRNHDVSPNVMTKMNLYKDPVRIRVIEKKQSFMETKFDGDLGVSKVCIDVHAIECVVPASTIMWVRPQVVGHYLNTPVYIINGILSVNLKPIDGSYKALFLKRSDPTAPQLAYLFRDGGRFVEVKEREKTEFVLEPWGQIDLPSCGGNVYLSSQELKEIESLF